jgi:hypothetical protein
VGRRRTRRTSTNGNEGRGDGRSGEIESLELHQAGKAAAANAARPGPEPGGNGVLRLYRRISAGLAVSDAICVVVALTASYYLRYPTTGLMPARRPSPSPSASCSG